MFDLVAKLCEYAVIFLCAFGAISLVTVVIYLISREIKEAVKSDRG